MEGTSNDRHECDESRQEENPHPDETHQPNDPGTSPSLEHMFPALLYDNSGDTPADEPGDVVLAEDERVEGLEKGEGHVVVDGGEVGGCKGGVKLEKREGRRQVGVGVGGWLEGVGDEEMGEKTRHWRGGRERRTGEGRRTSRGEQREETKRRWTERNLFARAIAGLDWPAAARVAG